MQTKIPSQAACLKCGYRLRGLPDAVCPECGQRFDPADATTFVANPKHRTRRRRVVALVAVVVTMSLLYGFGPRRVKKGSINFVCGQCGYVVSVTRWELGPPKWIPWRYPGMNWRTETPGQKTRTGNTVVPCNHNQYAVRVKVDLHICGSCAGTSTPAVGEHTVVNGRQTTLATAASVLESMMSPSNQGISIGSN